MATEDLILSFWSFITTIGILTLMYVIVFVINLIINRKRFKEILEIKKDVKQIKSMLKNKR